MDSQDAISPASLSATCVTSFSRQSTATTQSSDFRTPFEKHVQLYKDLDFTRGAEKLYRLQCHGSNQTLPDAPRVRLDCPSMILSHCLDDLDTPRLNKLGRKLWWAAPTPEIVSLSQQTVLDRRIQITEDPSVHMLWVEGIIYVKPLPAYLASHAWWEWLSDSSNTDLNAQEKERLRATSLGFLRTYARLIQRRSDFNLARRHELLGQLSVSSFEEFVAFISSFDGIPESSVSSRWRYGLLQLDALNFHSAWLLRRWHLNRYESRYGTYFSRLFPVVLFMFALFSVMLSAMQVILAAKQLWETDNKGLKRILDLFVWFGTESIGWSLAFAFLFVIWFILISSMEGVKRRRTQHRTEKRFKAEGLTA